MMPTPFVLNDAVVIKQRIKPTPVVVPSTLINPTTKDSLAIVQDSLRVK